MNTQTVLQYGCRANIPNRPGVLFCWLLVVAGLAALPAFTADAAGGLSLADQPYTRYCVNGESMVVTTPYDEEISAMGCTEDHCTLREAVQAANLCTGDQVGTIVLDENEYYSLARGRENNARSALVITGNVYIVGNGSVVQIFNQYEPDEKNIRVFEVAANGILTAQDLVITTGLQDEGAGMLIAEAGAANLYRTRFSSNNADVCGAISNYGRMKLRDSAVTSNVARTRGGGVCNHRGGVAIIDRSDVSGNVASPRFYAEKFSFTVDVEEGGYGGGVYNDGLMFLKASVIQSNRGEGGAAGVYHVGGKLNLLDSTVIENTVGDGSYGIPAYGNDSLRLSGGLALLGDTRVSNSYVGRNYPRDCTSSLNDGIDLRVGMFTDAGTSMNSDTSCEVHPAFRRSVDSDPQISCEYDSDFTFTCGLGPGSPLIDAGSTCKLFDFNRQQRPRDGDLDGEASCDIGAIEYSPCQPGLVYEYTNCCDPYTGVCGPFDPNWWYSVAPL